MAAHAREHFEREVQQGCHGRAALFQGQRFRKSPILDHSRECFKTAQDTQQDARKQAARLNEGLLK
jgi:hypothetical protein